jgi:hypothetical protein
MVQLRRKWHDEQLPKRQPKAWGIWQKSRLRRNKRERINAAQQRLDQIVNARLVKMRQEILNDQWTTSKQVHGQCQVMEQSIFNREDLLWEISVLEQTKPPARPSLAELAASRTTRTGVYHVDLDGDEEILETDSDSASSIDGVGGGFVTGSGREYMRGDELPMGSAHLESGVGIPRDAAPDNSESTVTSVEDEAAEDALMSGTVDGVGDIDPSSSGPDLPPGSSSSPETLASTDIWNGGSMSGRSANLAGLSLSSGRPDMVSPVAPAGGRPLSAISTSTLEGTPYTRLPSDIGTSAAVKTPPTAIPYSEAATIASYGYKVWEEEKDPGRLLIAILYNMPSGRRDGIMELLSAHALDKLWTLTVDVMQECREGRSCLRGMDSTTFGTFANVIALFDMYVDCRKKRDRGGHLEPVTYQKLLDSGAEKFEPFAAACLSAAKTGVDFAWVPANDDKEPLGTMEGLVTRRVSGDKEPVGTIAKRRRRVFEDVEARRLREDDQMRLAEQERRRQILRQKLAQSGVSHNADGAKIIINESKFEDEGFVFVHDHIGSRIKKHQVDGVRFMWSQIVSRDGSRQGCLLAHTMSLGKTMQVITLLVAIAEAACSQDSSVSSQIPEGLKRSRTLVLCPPGLMDNWMDELLTWVPEDVAPKVGRFRKVDSGMKFEERLTEIDLWYREGGVILLGFEMFRNILGMGPGEDKKSKMDLSTFRVVEDQLLGGPNIIIADEAHKLKNVSSGLTIAAARFRSNSRIALTGSPLSNNVEEYHSMIEWIAPNYLGPIVEFRGKFVHPIHEGLYENSSRSERRRGLKMLEVLKEDISPKVNRADSSVLKNDLKPKVEFVITVPLTELQHEAYTIYVQTMLGVPLQTNHVTGGGKLRQTTLWSWVGLLALLCNHPLCL